MSEKLRERQKKMRSWLVYLSTLSDEDIRQNCGHAYVSISPGTGEREVKGGGVCAGCHYAIHTGLLKPFKLVAETMDARDLAILERYNAGFWRRAAKASIVGPYETVHFSHFYDGMLAMADDFSDGSLLDFGADLESCIRDYTMVTYGRSGFPDNGHWAIDFEARPDQKIHVLINDEISGEETKQEIPLAFNAYSWPCPPLGPFLLYAERFLGMSV